MLKHDLRLYPYRPRLLQEISDGDRAHRASFCEEMIFLLDNDLSFLDQLFFSDEAHFQLPMEILIASTFATGRLQIQTRFSQLPSILHVRQFGLHCGPVVLLARFSQ